MPLIFVLVADLASQKVSFDSPRHEINGGTNNSVFLFLSQVLPFPMFSHIYVYICIAIY